MEVYRVDRGGCHSQTSFGRTVEVEGGGEWRWAMPGWERAI